MKPDLPKAGNCFLLGSPLSTEDPEGDSLVKLCIYPGYMGGYTVYGIHTVNNCICPYTMRTDICIVISHL